VFTRDQYVAVGCDRQVERAELRIEDQLCRVAILPVCKRDDGVVAFPIWIDTRGQGECAIVAECKTARKRYDPCRQNADGSTDLYLGPKAPPGKEANWLATVPGKGYFAILRLYGPTESTKEQMERLPTRIAGRWSST
jgi:hypothetical protein